MKTYKTIILLAVLWDCETWSPILREGCRLRVFENRISRSKFGPMRDANLEWRGLQNEKIHSLYRPPNLVKFITPERLRWADHVTRREEDRSVLKILTGKPTGKKSR